MNKKKMILTSLASVAILGAGFVTSSPTFVRAEEAPVASQSKAEKDYDAAKKDAKNAKKAVEDAQKALDDAKAAQKNMTRIRRKLKRKLLR